jgi:hypothetical protein
MFLPETAALPAVAVSLACGVLAAALILLILRRCFASPSSTVAGRSWSWGRQTSVAVVAGLAVGTALWGLIGQIEEPLPTDDWISRKMSEGKVAPDFELIDVHSGKKIRFSSFRGSRPAVLIFASFG